VVYNVRDLHGPAWTPGALLAAVAASSFVVTALLPNSGRRSRLLRSAGLVSVIGATVAAGGFLSGSHVGAVVAIVASGAFFAVLSPANVVVGPLLPSAVRASAFSVLMGVLVIAQTMGASAAGLLADHLSTAHAAALACLPAAAGGLWVLMVRRVPAGFADDIEAPLLRLEIREPTHVDLVARLAPATRTYAAVQPVRASGGGLRGGGAGLRPAAPEYAPEYSPRS
jgi:MFS family permease